MIRRPIQKCVLHIGKGNRGVHASYLQTSLPTSSVALSPRAPTPRRQHAPYASVGLAGSTRAFSAQSQPKLAYEWIVDGKLIPQSKVDVEEVGDKEVILFLHGLLGNAKVRDPGVVCWHKQGQRVLMDLHDRICMIFSQCLFMT